jgi:hypothetical protein
LNKGSDLTDHDRSAIVCLLKDLLLSAEKLASDIMPSDDRLLDLVDECERSVGQLRAMMDSGHETEARDGAESGGSWTSLESDESIKTLIHQVDEGLRHCIGELAARKQRIACELDSLRSTRRATKAYQGMEQA